MMTITMALDNPKLSLDELDILHSKVESNTATAEDYEKLDYFLSSAGIAKDFILENFKENGIRSYSEYVLEMKKPLDKRKDGIGELHGSVLGVLSILKDFLSGKIK